MTADGKWRQEFVRLLSSPKREDWDRARAVRLAQIPPTLFRYERPTGQSLENLRRGTIWLSAVSKFNDLHDTSVHVDALRGVNALLRKSLANGTLGLSPELFARVQGAADPIRVLDEILVAEVAKQQPEVAEKARDFLRNFAIQHSREMTAKTSEFFQRATKVACFCESGTLPALWAYYAEGHTGFCVEYPFSGLPPEDFRVHWLLPVVYSSERFSLTSLIERLDGAMNPFIPWLASIHKAPDWAPTSESGGSITPLGTTHPGRNGRCRRLLAFCWGIASHPRSDRRSPTSRVPGASQCSRCVRPTRTKSS